MEIGNKEYCHLFFLSFNFFVFFIMFNMFMAIVNDTYADVKGEADMKPDEDFPIGEWFAARKEAFFFDIFHYFVFCIEDDVPIWTALERTEFLGNEVHWKQFKKKLIQEGADIGEIIEVFEHYDTDKDFILTREEISIMKSHVTVHHDLKNPGENRHESAEIKRGKALGLIERIDFNMTRDRVEAIDEKLVELEKRFNEVDREFRILIGTGPSIKPVPKQDQKPDPVQVTQVKLDVSPKKSTPTQPTKNPKKAPPPVPEKKSVTKITPSSPKKPTSQPPPPPSKKTEPKSSPTKPKTDRKEKSPSKPSEEPKSKSTTKSKDKSPKKSTATAPKSPSKEKPPVKSPAKTPKSPAKEKSPVKSPAKAQKSPAKGKSPAKSPAKATKSPSKAPQPSKRTTSLTPLDKPTKQDLDSDDHDTYYDEDENL